MSCFVFLTRTRWDEPPRIRHQIAHLLANAGHDVLFFQKPVPPWRAVPTTRPATARITLAGYRELVNHKLRLIEPIHHLNAGLVRRTLRRQLARHEVPPDAVVVNFNYDYWFLRDLFPRSRRITVINDDFWSTALFGYTRPLLSALRRTCRESDHVLTVSEPLQRQLDPFCRAELFLPWSEHAYREPVASGARDVILYWGFLNRKLDFTLLNALASHLAHRGSHLRLMLVGPTEQRLGGQFDALVARENVDIRPATQLEQLPLDRVLAGILPYRSDRPDVDAIALPNKALRLLANGLPLLITGMPNFIQQPFVFRLAGPADGATLELVASRFRALQPAIAAFVAEHSPQARLTQLLRMANGG